MLRALSPHCCLPHSPLAPSCSPPLGRPFCKHSWPLPAALRPPPPPAATPPRSSPPPSRSLSPTWRANAPAQELYVVNFNRLLMMGDCDGAAALLARAPGLVNAAKDGQPPLHAAVRAKSLPLVQLLAQRGRTCVRLTRRGAPQWRRRQRLARWE